MVPSLHEFPSRLGHSLDFNHPLPIVPPSFTGLTRSNSVLFIAVFLISRLIISRYVQCFKFSRACKSFNTVLVNMFCLAWFPAPGHNHSLDFCHPSPIVPPPFARPTQSNSVLFNTVLLISHLILSAFNFGLNMFHWFICCLLFTRVI
jgi:hypothetical protein